MVNLKTCNDNFTERDDLMKNKKQVPYHQYIISIICVAFLAGGSGYIFFDYQFKKQLANTTVQNSDLKKLIIYIMKLLRIMWEKLTKIN